MKVKSSCLVHLLVSRACEANSRIAGRIHSSTEQRKAIIIASCVAVAVYYISVVKKKYFCLLSWKETKK